MTVDVSSLALRKELSNPSVLDVADFSTASKSHRKIIQSISQQVSVLQQLVTDVEEDEQNIAVKATLESFAANLRAIQRRHDRVEEELSLLSRGVKEFAGNRDRVIAIIDGNE